MLEMFKAKPNERNAKAQASKADDAGPTKDGGAAA
jgi:hypothetical protein